MWSNHQSQLLTGVSHDNISVSITELSSYTVTQNTQTDFFFPSPQQKQLPKRQRAKQGVRRGRVTRQSLKLQGNFMLFTLCVIAVCPRCSSGQISEKRWRDRQTLCVLQAARAFYVWVCDWLGLLLWSLRLLAEARREPLMTGVRLCGKVRRTKWRRKERAAATSNSRMCACANSEGGGSGCERRGREKWINLRKRERGTAESDAISGSIAARCVRERGRRRWLW